MKRAAGLIGAGGVALLVAVAALGVGSSGLGPRELIGAAEDPTARAVLLGARLPRVLFGCIAGAALAVGGATFQAILRNPLADPYILGVSGGAALGATLWMATGLGAGLGVPGAAALGALGAMAALLGAQRWLGRGASWGQDLYALLLTGVIFNAFAAALITLIKAVVSAQKAQELLMYLMGTLSVERLPLWVIGVCAALVAAACGGVWAKAGELNILSLGDVEAQALGVEVRRTRLWCVILASVAVAVAVAYTGLIGFVGLVVPHGVRLLLGPDHRTLIPASMMLGAALVVGCDALARVGFHWVGMTLPVGVITSLVGAPLFMALLRRTLVRRA